MVLNDGIEENGGKRTLSALPELESVRKRTKAVVQATLLLARSHAFGGHRDAVVPVPID